MFDNLKSKLKGLFKKAPAEIAEEAPAAPAETPAVPEQPARTMQELPTIEDAESE